MYRETNQVLVTGVNLKYKRVDDEEMVRRSVMNDEDELRTVIRTGRIQSVMSDRPSEAMRVVRQETTAAA